MSQEMMDSSKKTSRLFFLVAALGLVSCSTTPTPEFSMSSVSIYSTPDTNQNSAIAVDLVIVYNNELLGTIGKMSAAQYFASSNQLLLDNPTLLDVWHWELVPGQIVQEFKPPQDKGLAFGAYVFANYLTPGDHRIKVAPDGVVNILLGKNDLKNLATLGSSDLQKGTTMTNAQPPQKMPTVLESIPEKQALTGKCNKGPTTTDLSLEGGILETGCKRKGPAINASQPCKPFPSQVIQQDECGQPCFPQSSASPGKPIPIIAQPLPPLTVKYPSKCK